MSYYKGIQCIKCGYVGREDEAFDACPVCGTQGNNVNFTTTYDFGQDLEKVRQEFLNAKGKGLWKHREFLPIAPETEPVSLGEGETPLLHCGRLGKSMGLHNLYIKNESVNPTWSYKDRLCSVAVTRAVQEERPVVTVSSTGNHGAATAAYSAAAGKPCVIFTLPQVPATMKTLMQSFGAYVMVTPKPIDRWTIMKKCVKEKSWYPLSGYIAPPIGSNCFGIDGYKTIAFELYEQLGDLPEFIAVPSAYSDGLYGVWKGVKDLQTIGLSGKKTKMIASEVFGSLKETLKEQAEGPVTVPSEWSISFSIAGPQGTYQGYAALKESEGYAETSSDEETIAMQLRLAKEEGIFAEAASVTSLVAIEKLAKEGKIAPDDKVVAVITSTGLKDPATTAEHLPPVPTIEPNYEELAKALKESYGYELK